MFYTNKNLGIYLRNNIANSYFIYHTHVITQIYEHVSLSMQRMWTQFLYDRSIMR